MSAIEEAVIQRIRERAEKGLAKYGTTLERTDLNLYDWLLHAQEECLDLMGYLERIRIDRGNGYDDALQMFIDIYQPILIEASRQLEFFLKGYKLGEDSYEQPSRIS